MQRIDIVQGLYSQGLCSGGGGGGGGVGRAPSFGIRV